ncbi:MAG: hypothetical protein QXQ66_09215, partial [Candidatus Hadarchaeum sp.]|uniref:hypothetical protein n=1 Tax=Candidatus Hadarchaeum sp. TaxID=2883567 RepID=UPI0031822972
MRLGTWLLIATVLTIGTVVACQGVERGEVGSRERPIIWFLPPGTDVRIQHTASLIAKRIGELCSYYILVQAATDSCALIAAFVGAPGDVMGLVDADSYLEIASRTNVAENVVVVGVTRGFVATPIGVYALRNRNIASRKDLMEKVWVYPSTTSKEYKISKLVFDREKLTFAGSLEAGSAVECLKALLDGRGDFCTAW